MSQNKLIAIILIIVLIFSGIFLFKVLNSNTEDTIASGKNSLVSSEILGEKNNITNSKDNITNTQASSDDLLFENLLASENEKANKTNNTLSNIVLFLQGLNIFSIIIGIAFYFMFSFGLMKLLDGESYPTWLAWIPIVQNLLIIDMAYRNRTITWIAVISFICLNFLGGLLALVSSLILLYLILNSLQKIYIAKSHHPTLLLVLTIISFGALIPVFIFAIRNN